MSKSWRPAFQKHSLGASRTCSCVTVSKLADTRQAGRQAGKHAGTNLPYPRDHETRHTYALSSALQAVTESNTATMATQTPAVVMDKYACANASCLTTRSTANYPPAALAIRN